MADALAADQHAPALLAGATPPQVAEAAGTSVRGMYEQWRQWADGQRHSLIAGRPGVTQEVYETIQACFVAVGEELLMRQHLHDLADP